MTTQIEEIRGWFAGRLPDDWFEGDADVTADRDEILVTGLLQDPEIEKDAGEEAVEAARKGRIRRYREETRGERMKIADEAQDRFGRQVSWGASIGDDRYIFTHLSVPAMTRLRITERRVLDTLVDAGAASSRSDALAWCVRLVAKNETEWLKDLRTAFNEVEKVRSQGPSA